mgnify:FL=1
MNTMERILTMGICILGTLLTRFLPFLLFRKKTPAFVAYLGKVLPKATFGLLVVYCLKDVHFLSGTHGLPEGIALLLTLGLHLWKRNMLLSVFVGTAAYMILQHIV